MGIFCASRTFAVTAIFTLVCATYATQVIITFITTTFYPIPLLVKVSSVAKTIPAPITRCQFNPCNINYHAISSFMYVYII